MSTEFTAAIHQGPRRADVMGLLQSAALPTSDLTNEDMKDLFYAGPATAPVGIVGVQFYGPDALSLPIQTHLVRGYPS